MVFNSVVAQTTKIQIINNCPDVVNQEFDIWINGIKMFNALPFRSAMPYTSVNTSTPVKIALSPGNSGNITDTFFSRTITFNPLPYHVIVINGTRVSTGYSPAKPLKFDIFQGGSEAAGIFGNVDLLFANGVSDGQTYDFKSGLSTLGDDVAFGGFGASYQSMAPNKTKIRLTNTTGITRINTYMAELDYLPINNQACVVVASGFVNPAANNNGASMGLWLAPSIGGPMIELLTTAPEPIARVQFIHNCADTTADTIDVYMNNTKIADDFKFRHATTFIDVIGKVPTAFSVAPRTSTSASSAFYTTNFTFDSLGTHIITANGIQSAAGYTPKPAFKLTKFDNGKEQAANTTSTDVLFMQGSTDAGTVTITEGITKNPTWFSNINYDNYSSTYYNTVANNAALNASYIIAPVYFSLDIGTDNLKGEAITLVSSGFVDSTKNSKGAQAWLYYAKSSGGPMKRLDKKPYTGIPNSPNTQTAISIFPNPVTNTLYIDIKAKITKATITNVYGATIIDNIVVKNNTININNLASGTYYLQLHTDKGSFTKSFIKQ